MIEGCIKGMGFRGNIQRFGWDNEGGLIEGDNRVYESMLKQR